MQTLSGEADPLNHGETMKSIRPDMPRVEKALHIYTVPLWVGGTILRRARGVFGTPSHRQTPSLPPTGDRDTFHSS